MNSRDKKEFYTKLLAKLLRIKNGEMTLDFYIEEVENKIKINSVKKSFWSKYFKSL